MSSVKSKENSTDLSDEKVPDLVHQENVPTIVEIENFRVLGLSPQDEDFYMNFPPEKRRKAIHKVCILTSLVHAALPNLCC